MMARPPAVQFDDSGVEVLQLVSNQMTLIKKTEDAVIQPAFMWIF